MAETRDLFKQRALPSQVKLVKEPRSKLRLVSTAEKAANPAKFSPGGSYLVRKSVKKVGGRTVFVRTSDTQDWRINVHHGKAAKLRAKGELGYGPRAEERAIPRSVQTFRLRHAYKKLEYAEKPAIPNAKRRKHRAARTYPITDEMRGRFWDLRERKLGGENIQDGDWHEMVDQARALRDPMLSALLKSP